MCLLQLEVLDTAASHVDSDHEVLIPSLSASLASGVFTFHVFRYSFSWEFCHQTVHKVISREVAKAATQTTENHAPPTACYTVYLSLILSQLRTFVKSTTPPFLSGNSIQTE